MTKIMQEWTKSPGAPIRVNLLLFDSFSNLCLANCIEPMRAANTLVGPVFHWSILTPNGGACRSSSGIDVLSQDAGAGMGACDYLFVLSSYHHDRHDTPAIRRLLRGAARKAKTIVGLDTAPWLLASAGLLDGRSATVHWDLLEAFTERFLMLEAKRARVLRDGPIMTCAGAMSALDLTLGLIADHLGLAARMEVEALFLHDAPPLRQGREPQITDPLVSRAVGSMRDSLEKPIALTGLARLLGCQPRTLDRRFRAALGAPPGTVYRHLRLAAARKLIEETTLGMAEISVRCGYESPAALSRAIRCRYGLTPRALRER